MTIFAFYYNLQSRNELFCIVFFLLTRTSICSTVIRLETRRAAKHLATTQKASPSSEVYQQVLPEPRMSSRSREVILSMVADWFNMDPSNQKLSLFKLECLLPKQDKLKNLCLGTRWTPAVSYPPLLGTPSVSEVI